MKALLKKWKNSAVNHTRTFADQALGVSLVPSYTADNPYRDYGVNINIGAGGWSHPNWICLDLPSDWYHGDKSTAFLPFDIMNDDIPFGDGEVDLIFCSQVIEHIPEDAADRLFSEFARVLATGGGVRVVTPDARLLFHMYRNAPMSYWGHRFKWARSAYSTEHDLSKWTSADFLIRELATPRLRFYKYASNPVEPDQVLGMSFEELIGFLFEGLKFRYETPGDHINWWTFEKLEQKFAKVGLSAVQSGFGQSMFPPFKEVAFFDCSHYWASFYADAVLDQLPRP